MAEHEKTVDLPAHEAAQATHRAVLVDIHDTDLPAVKTVAEKFTRQLIAHTVYCTEDEYALKNTNLDVFLADAIAGTIYDLVFEVYLELDGAATYTITISKTDALNPTSFTSQLLPAISTIVTPAAAGRYRYPAGDLAQGDQCKFNIAQDNNGDAAHDIVATMTCKQ